MERLPDELVLLVLEKLPLADLLSSARVCRRWRALVATRALHLRRRSHERRLRPCLRVLLVSARGVRPIDVLARTPYLRELTLHARVSLTGPEFESLQHLQHLRHLDAFARNRILEKQVIPVARRLQSFVINDTVAPRVLRAMRFATRLRALHMYGRSRYFIPRELVAVLDARRMYLTDLTLRCHELPDLAFTAIGACSALVSLRLYSCWMLTSSGAAHVTRPLGLRTLHVTGARMLRPTALHGFIDALPPRLEELVLSACWFGDEHVVPLGARCPTLRSLELWRCYLSAGGVRALAAALPRLQELDVDVPLDAGDVCALTRLGRPQRLHCSRAEGARLGRRARLLQRSGARVARGAWRGGGEGWRAELFYSWCTAPRTLQGETPPPAFQDDGDDDYSLFGTDDDDDDDEDDVYCCYDDGDDEAPVVVAGHG